MPCTCATTCSTTWRASSREGPTIDTANLSGPVRPATTGDEREQQHLGELDDALGGAAEGEHLEDRRALADLPVGPAQLVARDLDRHRPLGEGGLFVDRASACARGRAGP
jgi:hypothetical protein